MVSSTKFLSGQITAWSFQIGAEISFCADWGELTSPHPFATFAASAAEQLDSASASFPQPSSCWILNKSPHHWHTHTLTHTGLTDPGVLNMFNTGFYLWKNKKQIWLVWKDCLFSLRKTWQQNCIWTSHRTSGTSSFGKTRPKWRCLATMSEPNTEYQHKYLTLSAPWCRVDDSGVCFAAKGPGNLAVIESTMNFFVYQSILEQTVQTSVWLKCFGGTLREHKWPNHKPQWTDAMENCKNLCFHMTVVFDTLKMN